MLAKDTLGNVRMNVIKKEEDDGNDGKKQKLGG